MKQVMLAIGNFKSAILIIFLISFAIFFYTFRLSETQLFINDTSRDTLAALRIWQNKQLTLIGASASFSQNTVQELFFGSLYLYIAILGMMLIGFDPIGAVIPNIILYLISIPIFYAFISRLLKKSPRIIYATILYALSPVVVTHARFFWNPNLLIPFSVFFWYLILSPVKVRFWSLKILSAGVVAGIMFNLHYFAIVPVLIYLVFLLLFKDFDRLVLLLGGLVLGISPLILFELRNNFYLLGAVKYNLNHGIVGISLTPQLFIDRFIGIFTSIIGLSHGEILFRTIISSALIKPAAALFLLGGIITTIIRRQYHKTDFPLLLCLFLTLVFTVYSSTYDLYLRYMFSVFPLLIWFIVKSWPESKFNRFITIIIFLPILYANISIVTAKVDIPNGYISLPKIREISGVILSDSPSGKYNITENIHGDARATAFRYFLLRDTLVKPQDETQYGGIRTLYVVTPSLEKTYQENRWELSASGSKEAKLLGDFGEVLLYKLSREPVR